MSKLKEVQSGFSNKFRIFSEEVRKDEYLKRVVISTGVIFGSQIGIIIEGLARGEVNPIWDVPTVLGIGNFLVNMARGGHAVEKEEAQKTLRRESALFELREKIETEFDPVQQAAVWKGIGLIQETAKTFAAPAGNLLLASMRLKSDAEEELDFTDYLKQRRSISSPAEIFMHYLDKNVNPDEKKTFFIGYQIISEVAKVWEVEASDLITEIAVPQGYALGSLNAYYSSEATPNVRSIS